MSYGIVIKKNFNIKDFSLLINSKKLIIKVNKDFLLNDFFIIFQYLITKFNSSIISVFLLKIDINDTSGDIIIQKKKTTLLEKIKLNNYNTDFESFILTLNEINEQNYYDSGTSFKGELLGIEIRFENEILIDENKTILDVYTLIQKEK